MSGLWSYRGRAAAQENNPAHEEVRQRVFGAQHVLLEAVKNDYDTGNNINNNFRLLTDTSDSITTPRSHAVKNLLLPAVLHARQHADPEIQTLLDNVQSRFHEHDELVGSAMDRVDVEVEQRSSACGLSSARSVVHTNRGDDDGFQDGAAMDPIDLRLHSAAQRRQDLLDLRRARTKDAQTARLNRARDELVKAQEMQAAVERERAELRRRLGIGNNNNNNTSDNKENVVAATVATANSKSENKSQQQPPPPKAQLGLQRRAEERRLARVALQERYEEKRQRDAFESFMQMLLAVEEKEATTRNELLEKFEHIFEEVISAERSEHKVACLRTFRRRRVLKFYGFAPWRAYARSRKQNLTMAVIHDRRVCQGNALHAWGTFVFTQKQVPRLCHVVRCLWIARCLKTSLKRGVWRAWRDLCRGHRQTHALAIAVHHQRQLQTLWKRWRSAYHASFLRRVEHEQSLTDKALAWSRRRVQRNALRSWSRTTVRVQESALRTQYRSRLADVVAAMTGLRASQLVDSSPEK
eukprot:PhM_4_TR4888/c0_g1_i2/m.27604